MPLRIRVAPSQVSLGSQVAEMAEIGPGKSGLESDRQIPPAGAAHGCRVDSEQRVLSSDSFAALIASNFAADGPDGARIH